MKRKAYRILPRFMDGMECSMATSAGLRDRLSKEDVPISGDRFPTAVPPKGLRILEVV